MESLQKMPFNIVTKAGKGLLLFQHSWKEASLQHHFKQ